MAPRWNFATYGKIQRNEGEDSLQAESTVGISINEQTSAMPGEVEEKLLHQSDWELVPWRFFFSFLLFKNSLETSSEESGPIKYYRTENSLENQMEAVLQGVCQEKNGNQGGKLWQEVEVLEETSNMCLEPLPSDIWHLRLKCSRECQLLLSTESEI